MIRKAYIRHLDGFPANESLFSAFEGFQRLGIETAPFTFGSDVKHFDIGPEVMVCGHVGDVLLALSVLGKPRPDPLDYPECLSFAIRRNIERTTLNAIRKYAHNCFIKPVQHKLFNGFVWLADSAESRIRAAGVDDDSEVYCCEVVEFMSKFRCYVLDGKFVGMKHYTGNPFLVPELETVELALRAMGKSVRAYSLDFGVCSDGETRLVEANDAFALGNYGIPCTTYAKMLSARWEELTA